VQREGVGKVAVYGIVASSLPFFFLSKVEEKEALIKKKKKKTCDIHEIAEKKKSQRASTERHSVQQADQFVIQQMLHFLFFCVCVYGRGFDHMLTSKHEDCFLWRNWKIKETKRKKKQLR
jgi:hypothetical protein